LVPDAGLYRLEATAGRARVEGRERHSAALPRGQLVSSSQARVVSRVKTSSGGGGTGTRPEYGSVGAGAGGQQRDREESQSEDTKGTRFAHGKHHFPVVGRRRKDSQRRYLSETSFRGSSLAWIEARLSSPSNHPLPAWPSGGRGREGLPGNVRLTPGISVVLRSFLDQRLCLPAVSALHAKIQEAFLP
jgi:hypothetical protein